MPDDHSEVVPLLPIPNRTVKRLCADDSAGSRVKVGHRQALMPKTPQAPKACGVLFLLSLMSLSAWICAVDSATQSQFLCGRREVSAIDNPGAVKRQRLTSFKLHQKWLNMLNGQGIALLGNIQLVEQ